MSRAPHCRTMFARLRSERRGAAAVEFAIVAPVLMIGMMGVFDLGYNMYTDTLLQGAIQDAARKSSIEGAGGSATALNASVARAVHDLAPQATVVPTRKYYTTFSDVSQPEEYDDKNSSGACDNNEPFEDANGNGAWDADRGMTGFGGARDAVLYTVTVTYPRPFPIAKFIGQSPNFTLVASTVLRNQPFNMQSEQSKVGKCT